MNLKADDATYMNFGCTQMESAQSYYGMMLSYSEMMDSDIDWVIIQQNQEKNTKKM